MSKEQEQEYCEHCGAKMQMYKVPVTKGLAKALIKLRRLEVALGKTEIYLEHDDKGSEFELTQNERRNMSRLRFLGLARYTEAHSGRWFITRRGYAFLRGEEIPKFVWIFRNTIQEAKRTDETTTLTQVFKGDIPYFENIDEIKTERVNTTLFDLKPERDFR